MVGLVDVNVEASQSAKLLVEVGGQHDYDRGSVRGPCPAWTSGTGGEDGADRQERENHQLVGR
jgi:hypothetical protein